MVEPFTIDVSPETNVTSAPVISQYRSEPPKWWAPCYSEITLSHGGFYFRDEPPIACFVREFRPMQARQLYQGENL